MKRACSSCAVGACGACVKPLSCGCEITHGVKAPRKSRMANLKKDLVIE